MRYWIVNFWVDRIFALVLITAILGGTATLFRKRNFLSWRRKLLITALLAGSVIGLLSLDLKAPVPQGAAYGQYIFSEDGTTANAARWRVALAQYVNQPRVRALEIGTWEGRSAIWFLENILTDPSSTITCIDLFDGAYEVTFDHNVKPFGSRVTKVRAPSQIGLRGLEPWSYDFAYIDGSHSAKDVLLDAMLAWDLVKLGGTIIFDDYEFVPADERFKGLAFRPKIAIDAFLHVMEPYIEIVHRDYQVIIRKRKELNHNSPQVLAGSS